MTASGLLNRIQEPAPVDMIPDSQDMLQSPGELRELARWCRDSASLGKVEERVWRLRLAEYLEDIASDIEGVQAA